MPPRMDEPGKMATVAPPKRLGLSVKTSKAVLPEAEVKLEPGMGKTSYMYNWSTKGFYVVAAYADEG
ncbi:unnamed protein product, partial [Choristocarpus tenellus]